MMILIIIILSVAGIYLFLAILGLEVEGNFRFANDRMLSNSLNAVTAWEWNIEEKTLYVNRTRKSIGKLTFPLIGRYHINGIGIVPFWYASHKYIRKYVKTLRPSKERDKKIRYENYFGVKLEE